MNERRLTVQEAAGELGISTDAVRMRLQRGTLGKHRGDDGRVYVLITGDETKPNARPNVDATPLLEAKDETIRILREQLEAEREAHREARRIIGGLVQRIPELEAPPRRAEEAQERPERGGEGDAPSDPPAERPSLWRRMFGGG